MTRREWVEKNHPELDIDRAVKEFCPDTFEDMPDRYACFKECSNYSHDCDECWNQKVKA